MEIASAFVTIRPETSGFESELAAAVGDVETPVTLTADVTADTSEAQDEVDSIEGTPVDVPVTADTTQAQASMDDLGGSIEAATSAAGVGGGALGGITSELGGLVGLSSGATLGLGAVAGGLAYAAGEASDAQVTLAQLDQMVENMGANAGVTSEGLQALATDLQQTAGFSDEAVMSGEAMVLMFENVRNTAGRPIFDQTIRSAADLARSPAFNGDIAGAARTLGRAIDDPTAGMGRLRRAGIQLTEAQQANITALQAQGDLEGAQAALLDIVEGKVGGLADAYGNTYAGSLDRAKEAVGEAAEALGAQMLPALEAVTLSVIDQVNRLNSWDQALNGALLSGPVQAISETLGGANQAIEAHGEVVGDLPAALGAAATAEQQFADAQQQASDAVANTLPSLGDIISTTDRAGDAFGILNASSDPQVIIDNLSAALGAWDNFQANITTVSQWGPNIAAALQQLGPDVAGGLTAALAQGNAATVVQLDSLISEIQARGGDASAVLTGFAQTGMAGAVAAVQGASGPMGAAGTAAGASGAAGIDAGLAFSNASGIGQIVGVQYGAGVASGISSMYGTISSVASNAVAGAGDLGAAYSRGQALGNAYGSGVVAGLAGQVGNAAATRASLDRAAESFAAGITRAAGANVGGTITVVSPIAIDGRTVAQVVTEHQRIGDISQGYEP